MDARLVGIGLAIGSGVGVALGSMLGAVLGLMLGGGRDVGLWLALGVPLGAGFGLVAALVWGEMARPVPPGTCPDCCYEIVGRIGGLPRQRGAIVCPECGQAGS